MNSVQILLKRNNMNIPNEWKYDNMLDKYYKEYDIKCNKLISAEYNHNYDK